MFITILWEMFRAKEILKIFISEMFDLCHFILVLFSDVAILGFPSLRANSMMLTSCKLYIIAHVHSYLHATCILCISILSTDLLLSCCLLSAHMQ